MFTYFAFLAYICTCQIPKILTHLLNCPTALGLKWPTQGLRFQTNFHFKKQNLFKQVLGLLNNEQRLSWKNFICSLIGWIIHCSVNSMMTLLDDDKKVWYKKRSERWISQHSSVKTVLVTQEKQSISHLRECWEWNSSCHKNIKVEKSTVVLKSVTHLYMNF